MDGFINLNKPAGMTSSRAVGIVRRKLPRGTRVGHAGTLDPMAEGVLPIMIGKATRLCDYLMDTEKEYVCVIALGVATDTQDAEGTPIGEPKTPATAEALKAVLPRFTGEILQVPSAYSALKVNGKRMCDILRAGGEVDPQARKITIHSIEYLRAVGEDAHELRVRCSKGTYIRALCADIGEALGCGGHMRHLTRTRTAGFVLANAVLPDEIGEDVEKVLIAPEEPIRGMPVCYAGSDLFAGVRCGNAMPLKKTILSDESADVFRVLVSDRLSAEELAAHPEEGSFAGICARDGEVLKFRCMLLEADK